jgi:flagellar motor switch protein FliG
MDVNDLAGSLKVSILLRSLDDGLRTMVLEQFTQQEKETVQQHLAQLDTVSPDVVDKISMDFARQMQDRRSLEMTSGGTGKIKPGETAAEGAEATTLSALQSMEPDHLLQLIRDEHPQTIAIILVHLKTDVAAELLGKLPEEKQADVAYRIANSEKVISGMIEEIDKVFEDILNNEEGSSTRKIGGASRLAEILNQIDGAASQMIIDEIEDNSPEMAAEIKQMMFVFEDIVLVDDKGLQAMLRKVETRELAVALKAATEQVKEKIFRNMSERAAAMVREEIEGLGSVRMKEVDDAQKSITRIIQEMEEKGELIIGGRGGEQFIA